MSNQARWYRCEYTKRDKREYGASDRTKNTISIHTDSQKSSCSSLSIAFFLSFVSCAYHPQFDPATWTTFSLTSQLFVTDRYVGIGPSSPGQVLFMDNRPTYARVRSRFRWICYDLATVDKHDESQRWQANRFFRHTSIVCDVYVNMRRHCHRHDSQLDLCTDEWILNGERQTLVSQIENNTRISFLSSLNFFDWFVTVQ